MRIAFACTDVYENKMFKFKKFKKNFAEEKTRDSKFEAVRLLALRMFLPELKRRSTAAEISRGVL